MNDKKFTMIELKKAGAAVADRFGVDIVTGCKLLGFYNAGENKDISVVADIVAGDYSAIPAAAAALSVSLAEKTVDHTKKIPDNAQKITTKKRSAAVPGSKSVHTTKKPSGGQQDDREIDGATDNNIGGSAFGMDGDIIPAEMVAASDYDLPADMGDCIEQWINDYATRYNIDLSRLNSQQWRSCCDYIGQQIKSKGILIDREKTRGGAVFTYKPERLEGLLYLWAFFSGVYKQVPLEGDFIAFTGVHRNYFYDYDGRGLTSSRVQIVKKAHEIEERGALSAAVGGGSNAVGGMFTLKTRHNYTETPTRPEMIAVVVPSAPSLPVLGGSDGLLEQKE